jgi:hypothetical protein
MGRTIDNGSPVALAILSVVVFVLARAASDCSSRTKTNLSNYFVAASSSKKKSYITVPGFQLVRAFELEYGECRYATG